MQFPEPKDFSLHESAKRKLAEFSRKYIPAICWMTNPDGSDRRPGIGLYEEGHELPDEAIKLVDGLRVVFPQSQKDISEFDGKVLHFDEERGFFLV